VREGTDMLQQGAIKSLCDAIQLRGVVRGKLSRRAYLLQVLIEHFAQVLASPVGSQDLDRLAVVLCDSPRLVHLVGVEGLVFGAQEEGGGVPGGVVSKGNEVPSTLACGDGGWSPYIGMYLISEVLGWCTDPDFRNGQTGGTREDARVTVCLL
jgi:hypothetical protein